MRVQISIVISEQLSVLETPAMIKFFTTFPYWTKVQ